MLRYSEAYRREDRLGYVKPNIYFCSLCFRHEIFPRIYPFRVHGQHGRLCTKILQWRFWDYILTEGTNCMHIHLTRLRNLGHITSLKTVKQHYIKMNSQFFSYLNCVHTYMCSVKIQHCTNTNIYVSIN